ncbi:MAG: hypothetical protein OXB96_02585 [Candidatus Kaiserbacteria bacterium]|nr:hypothetical protein [Candidatus Kaiserbacteria bacterium]
MIGSIKSSISVGVVKKIFGNKENARVFLDEIGVAVPKSVSAEEVYASVVKHWDYKEGIRVVRGMFVETEKYQNGKSADKEMVVLINEWERMKLGEIGWPFSQGKFDGFVQRLNAERVDRVERDKKVKRAAVQYRRIKEINTLRNDFIETLIFEKNENILPTLDHRKGVDFFIDGEPYDQKVSASPTSQFKQNFGKGETSVTKKVRPVVKDEDSHLWRETAIKRPDLVAEYLYRYQDEGRFDADPRLLVVYLDEDVCLQRIEEIVTATDLTDPLEVVFQYRHKSVGLKQYETKCFVILLYNGE